MFFTLKSSAPPRPEFAAFSIQDTLFSKCSFLFPATGPLLHPFLSSNLESSLPLLHLITVVWP